MSRARLIFSTAIVIAIVSLLSGSAFAQYGASLQGTIQDKSGAVVKDAKVTATNQSTGVSRETMTSGSGFYRIAGLTPGKYTVVVEATSFKKETRPDVEVLAETTRGLDVALEAGSAQEVVNVTGDVPTLETEDASVNGT